MKTEEGSLTKKYYFWRQPSGIITLDQAGQEPTTLVDKLIKEGATIVLPKPLKVKAKEFFIEMPIDEPLLGITQE